MYKTEIFYSWYSLKNFLNERGIKKTDIIHIETFNQGGIALLYHVESEE